MTSLVKLRIGKGTLRPELRADTLFLTVPDIQGTYSIPYIQSERILAVTASFASTELTSILVSLSRSGGPPTARTLLPESPAAQFDVLEPGEYSLEACGADASGVERFRARCDRIGIGSMIAALGDSITEGYRGVGFWRGEHLHPWEFPPEAVSRDGRNFPQYAPTTHRHQPEVNCFQSWMTDLNDALSDTWGHPVFIANEGWGAYSTADYLRLMRTDRGWQERMHLLRPQWWLIHLGVNDAHGNTLADTFAGNMEAIVRELLDHYEADPELILLAKPSYDYTDGVERTLAAYSERVDTLVRRMRLGAGPDLFAAFSRNRERWYGADPVHPNQDGMRFMAGLWHRAIAAAGVS